MNSGLLYVTFCPSVCLSVRLWLDQNSDWTKIHGWGNYVDRNGMMTIVNCNCGVKSISSRHWHVCSIQRQDIFGHLVKNILQIFAILKRWFSNRIVKGNVQRGPVLTGNGNLNNYIIIKFMILTVEHRFNLLQPYTLYTFHKKLDKSKFVFGGSKNLHTVVCCSSTMDAGLWIMSMLTTWL